MDANNSLTRWAVFILELKFTEETIRSIKSVLAFSTIHIDIYVHTNGVETVRNHHLNDVFRSDEINVSYTKKNLGFSDGNNFLLKKTELRNKQYDYIMLLNNDAILDNNVFLIIDKILSAHKDIGIIGPRIIKDKTDGIIENDGAITWLCFMQQKFLHSGEYSDKYVEMEPYVVPFVSGACMVVRYQLFKRLGGFDTQFFAYFEDWDLCLRAQSLGYRCFHEPNAVVRHTESLTIGKDSLHFHFLMTRNRYLMAKKHLSPLILYLLFLPYFFIFRILYKTIKLSLRGEFNGIKGIYNALLWLIVPKKFKSKFWPIKNST